MQIRLKLMGTLKARAPAAGVLEVSDGTSIEDVLRVLEIAPQAVQVVAVNGQLERNRGRVLASGDELSIIPAVGGG